MVGASSAEADSNTLNLMDAQFSGFCKKKKKYNFKLNPLNAEK